MAAAKKSAAKKSAATVQYRVAFGKSDEAIEGPDDADVVVRVAARDAGADPWVSYMRGALKAEGSVRALFVALASGEAEATLSRLASRP